MADRPAFDATLALYRIDESNMSIFINGVTCSIPKRVPPASNWS